MVTLRGYFWNQTLRDKISIIRVVSGSGKQFHMMIARSTMTEILLAYAKIAVWLDPRVGFMYKYINWKMAMMEMKNGFLGYPGSL